MTLNHFCNPTGYSMLTNNNQSNKGELPHYVKNNIPATIKPAQTFIQCGIKPFLKITPNDIITNGLIHKHSVDINVEYFFMALETIVSSHD